MRAVCTEKHSDEFIEFHHEGGTPTQIKAMNTFFFLLDTVGF